MAVLVNENSYNQCDNDLRDYAVHQSSTEAWIIISPEKWLKIYSTREIIRPNKTILHFIAVC